MPHRITPMAPDRAASGYWTHPDYFVPANDRTDEAPGEFDAWLDSNALFYAVSWLENELPAAQRRAWKVTKDNVSAWVPVPPPGAGWFAGSIHYVSGQGAACVWLRYREDAGHAVAS